MRVFKECMYIVWEINSWIYKIWLHLLYNQVIIGSFFSEKVCAQNKFKMPKDRLQALKAVSNSSKLIKIHFWWFIKNHVMLIVLIHNKWFWCNMFESWNKQKLSQTQFWLLIIPWDLQWNTIIIFLFFDDIFTLHIDISFNMSFWFLYFKRIWLIPLFLKSTYVYAKKKLL